MKILFIFLSSSLSLLLNAQFNEGFFERLGPFSNKPGHFYGTAITNGALGVRLADSVDTEVQWVKLDLNGNFQTFSAHLPTDYISPNERIIEVYEIGNHQFIVSQDSASNNSEGLKVYKYQNYTQSAGFLDFPVQLRNAYFQSYYKFGKIYIFYVESNVGMKMLKINPETLAIEENLFLGALNYPTQDVQRHYKQTHVLFENENNMQVFCHSGTNLVRIKVVNNLASPIEMNDLGIIKVFGVNHSTNQIICLKNSLTHRVKKYLNTENFNELQLVDSLTFSLSINGPSSYVKYQNNDLNKEIFSSEFDFNLFENGQLIAENEINSSSRISTLTFLNNFPLVFANTQHFLDGYYNINLSYSLVCIYMYNNNVLPNNEYYEEANFTNFNVRTGLGPDFLNVDENGICRGDYLFSNMIYGSSLNIVGKYNENVFGVTSLFENNKYKPGPYTDYNLYNHDIVHNFNENFYIDKAMCNQHVFAISTNLPNYQIPNGIKNWPAHGDISLGQAQNLAPFIDINQNGIYEPEQGEYPSFPGTRCLLNITHQHENDFEYKGLGVELHSYIYAFDCEDSIKEVIFYKSELFNRTSRNYDSLAVGVFNDYDLGGYNDDYVGTHVETGMIYAYNGDNYDDDQGGASGFHDSLPTIGNLFLKGVKFPNNLIDDEIGVSPHQTINGFGFNDGIVDNEHKTLEHSFVVGNGASISSDPTTSEQYFNYLNGKWRFGETLYYGGTGFQGSTSVTTIPAKYMYPGNSDPLHYGTNGIDPSFEWSEESINNPPGDRRILGSFGSTPLNAGEKLEYHFAYLAGKRVPGFGQSQQDLFAKAKHVKNAFNSNLTSCGQTFDNLTQEEITSVTKIDTKNLIKLYPNPSSDKINIIVPQNTDFQIEIIDISGKSLFKEQLVLGINEIDVKDFKSGIYFVKFISGNSIETIKFIKN